MYMPFYDSPYEILDICNGCYMVAAFRRAHGCFHSDSLTGNAIIHPS